MPSPSKRHISFTPISEDGAANATLAYAPEPQPKKKHMSPRPRTLYIFGHPAMHARHKILNFRPKPLLQVQKVQKAARPLPILNVLASATFVPPLARKFPRIFKHWNGQGPDDLIVMRSELWEQAAGIRGSPFAKHEKGRKKQEVVATICEPTQKHARSQGKANIFFKSGPLCSASPLPCGSYEFSVKTKYGALAMRWVLRSSKNQRTSISSTVSSISQPQYDSRRFTFSVIDPKTRRHPVAASMFQSHLEVYESDVRDYRSSVSPVVLSPVASELGDKLFDGPDTDAIILDEPLQLLIIVTGIWVAFREGWSQSFRYRDEVALCRQKSID